MPNNAILIVGLGLAAFTLFRREEADVGETDLVDASMLSSGTGDTGKALGNITTIKSDEPIGGFPLVIPVTDTDVELPNVRTGPLPQVPVTPAVQTPVYIQQTGEQAGQALAQIGITTDPADIDLLNPRIYGQVITTPGEDIVAPVTMTDSVQIVPGGANLGGAYFTTLETLGAARDQGYFSPTTWEQGIGPNVFDAQAAAEALAIMTEPKEQSVFTLPIGAGGSGDYGIDIWGGATANGYPCHTDPQIDRVNGPGVYLGDGQRRRIRGDLDRQRFNLISVRYNGPGRYHLWPIGSHWLGHGGEP